MKKLFIIIISSLLFLFGVSFVSLLLSIFSFTKAWIPLTIGSSIIVLSIIMLIIYLKSLKTCILYLIFIVNMIAMGFLIKSWHIYRGYNLELHILLLIAIACSLYLIGFFLLSLIPIFSSHYEVFSVIVLLLSIISYVVLIILTSTNYLSTYGYYMIIEIGFIFALSVYNENYKSMMKSISFSTFLVIIVAIIIALIMLDGEPDFDIINNDFNLMSPKEQMKIKSLK